MQPASWHRLASIPTAATGRRVQLSKSVTGLPLLWCERWSSAALEWGGGVIALRINRWPMMTASNASLDLCLGAFERYRENGGPAVRSRATSQHDRGTQETDRRGEERCRCRRSYLEYAQLVVIRTCDESPSQVLHCRARHARSHTRHVTTHMCRNPPRNEIIIQGQHFCFVILNL